jgi:hypothetical protein
MAQTVAQLDELATALGWLKGDGGDIGLGSFVLTGNNPNRTYPSMCINTPGGMLSIKWGKPFASRWFVTAHYETRNCSLCEQHDEL